MAVHAGNAFRPPVIFHITRKLDWDAATGIGSYAADSLHTEGFIHCSTNEQVIATANRLFRNRHDLVLLCIATDRIHAEIRHENLEGGGNLFPHIYGAIALDAVIAVHDFVPRDDGYFDLPPTLELENCSRRE
jgi:uncharacterized protein (DUF952 family)